MRALLLTVLVSFNLVACVAGDNQTDEGDGLEAITASDVADLDDVTVAEIPTPAPKVQASLPTQGPRVIGTSQASQLEGNASVEFHDNTGLVRDALVDFYDSASNPALPHGADVDLQDATIDGTTAEGDVLFPRGKDRGHVGIENTRE